jgi:flagellar biosynthesis protein FliR
MWRESKLDRLDWLWYIGLPILSYVLILAAAIGIWVRAALALDVLGGTMILLLIVGIRNAWDLVIWMSQQHVRQ